MKEPKGRQEKSAVEEWEEKRYRELRDEVSGERVVVAATVDYYGAKAMELNKKLRWAATVAAVSAVLTAALLPWVPAYGLVLAVPAAALSLVSPLLAAWAKGMGWRNDLTAYVRAQDAARFLETEVEAMYTRLDLRDYATVDEMIQQFQFLKRRWEHVAQLPPPDVQDDELVEKFWKRAEKGLGLESPQQI